ncbi:tyrosine recombinase XerC [Peptoniphilus stercorisuis]|uniref:Site-specific recombinase XerD n=1 Tax=Peptoniphilus stercorisuis TaxID=1436965 RepID=A0ABS4KCK0_9FIRM|nr:tyrosine recombinase XerC [Peptoniphilus stercorisuis]MBP2025511.1 site-specific recombinase XerD [Peptoniphilus stercorisuis]
MIKSNLLDDFLDYMKSTRGSSESTVKEYYYDIRLFLRFLKQRRGLAKDIEFDDISIEDIDIELLKSVKKQDIYAFNAFLEKTRKVSNRSKYRKISSIRTFFNYLSAKVDLIEYNPIENIDMPKLEKTLPEYLDLNEALNLLDTIKNTNKKEIYKTRDYAIVTLFLNCGMRLSELSGINLDDISNDNTLRVLGKGNKERTIYLNNACQDALEDYMKNRPDIESNALFLSMRNNRMSNRAIQHMIEKYIVDTGLDSKKYSVHKLRHTAATLMYQYGGADIRSLQEILGHESITTTQIYTHVRSEQLKNTVNSNPLANIGEDED